VNNHPFKLGITGGIGSGKSTICQVLEVLKIPIYYADDRSKWLLNNDDHLIKGVVSIFGKDSYVQGLLNRSYVASRVFTNKELLNKMNALVHPRVKIDFEEWCGAQSSSVIAKEAALLFETGSYKELDSNWVVYCPRELRIARVKKRDPQRTLEEIEGIIERQWEEERTVELADYVINNNDQALVVPQILKGLAILPS
jgi:dephospho-CoA kinase